MKTGFFILLSTSILIGTASGQKPGALPIVHPPLTPPLYASGTFGELRNNHFHAGVDLRTNEEIGKPVYSVNDGFVSRIKVSPVGYGLALYIDHPTGHTSVYAHLDRYDGPIAAWVERAQRARRFWELDTLLAPAELPVRGGERIGTSGNSGGSAGPHVHFELRETKSEHPLNPLFYGLDVVDDLPPNLRAVHLQDAQGIRKFIPISDSLGKRLMDTVTFRSPLGVVLDGEDLMQPNGPRNGVYGVEQRTSSGTSFGYRFDSFDFADGRAVNATLDGTLFAQTGKRMYRVYRQPFHPGPAFYSRGVEGLESPLGGRITAEPGQVQRVVWRMTDARGRSDSVWALLKCTGVDPFIAPVPARSDSIRSNNGWRVLWTSESFYRMTSVQLISLHAHEATLKWIGPAHAPLRLYPPTPTAAAPKTFWVWTSTTGKKSWMPPPMPGGFWEIKEPGSGRWTTDHTPPTFKKSTWPSILKSGQSLRFTGGDSESGMAYYGGILDNDTFVLVSYDAKYKSFLVLLPEEVAPGKHRLEIVLRDRAGNEARFFHSFSTLAERVE